MPRPTARARQLANARKVAARIRQGLPAKEGEVRLTDVNNQERDGGKPGYTGEESWLCQIVDAIERKQAELLSQVDPIESKQPSLLSTVAQIETKRDIPCSVVNLLESKQNNLRSVVDVIQYNSSAKFSLRAPHRGESERSKRQKRANQAALLQAAAKVPRLETFFCFKSNETSSRLARGSTD